MPANKQSTNLEFQIITDKRIDQAEKMQRPFETSFFSAIEGF